MSEKINTLIQDLTIFFIKENYKKYLENNKINSIPENKLNSIIDKLYIEKNHLKEFIKNSLKEILKNDYIGDLVLENIFTEMFNDELLCKNRLVIEIKLFQEKNRNEKMNYDNIL